MKKNNNYTPRLPAEKINKIVRELSNPKLSPDSYSHYQKTEEWVIIKRLLKELEKNADIEIRTSPEYVIGYMVKELRNKDLPLLTKKTSKSTSIKKHL